MAPALHPSRPSPAREQMREIADAVNTNPPRLRRREVVLEDDHRVGLSMCGRIVVELPAAGATRVTVDGAGHAWMLEDPDTLPAMLAELLDGPLGDAIDSRARGRRGGHARPRRTGSLARPAPLSRLPGSAPATAGRWRSLGPLSRDHR